MMGPYYYYDTSFVEDVPAELHIHDCMWSGECYSCQPTRVTFSNTSVQQHQHQQSLSTQPPLPGTHGTVPITVGGPSSGGYITLTATARQETPTKRLVWPDKAAVPIKLEEKCRLEREQIEEELEEEDVEIAEADEDSPESSFQSAPICSPRRQRAAMSVVTTDKPACKVKRTNKGSNHSSSSSSDNKKLRHREVEKNRHRQLQAMVKTLSEKIPGRLDKETQVQTMKRAARYCVYLRDVVSILSHQGQSSALREGLEKSYLRSCDYVQGVHSD